ncbi:DivIVA domain-containing protein [Nocardioides dubius]|uniref:DivIVA domain-containing protein n=1 Tax=Nocardioides dubius TaxID=317019 RepID=A0ABP4EF87_9ACTN
MMWLFAALAVLALGAIAVVASGRGEPMREAGPDRAPFTVGEAGPLGPGTALRGEHLRQARFSTAIRGYRMDEVDALLARLATQLEQAEQATEQRAEPAVPGANPTPPGSMRGFVDEAPSS